MTLFTIGIDIKGQCSLRLLLAVPEISLWGQERLKKQNTHEKFNNNSNCNVLSFKFSVSASCLEALRQTNLTMKERFEGLTAWREKQREERDFLESRLEEARVRMQILTLQNQELSRKIGEEGKPGATMGGLPVRVYLNKFLPICLNRSKIQTIFCFGDL